MYDSERTRFCTMLLPIILIINNAFTERLIALVGFREGLNSSSYFHPQVRRWPHLLALTHILCHQQAFVIQDSLVVALQRGHVTPRRGLANKFTGWGGQQASLLSREKFNNAALGNTHCSFCIVGEGLQQQFRCNMYCLFLTLEPKEECNTSRVKPADLGGSKRNRLAQDPPGDEGPKRLTTSLRPGVQMIDCKMKQGYYSSIIPTHSSRR